MCVCVVCECVCMCACVNTCVCVGTSKIFYMTAATGWSWEDTILKGAMGMTVYM